MDRTDLFEIAKKHGAPKMTPVQKKALRAEIAARLTGAEIAEAPRVFGSSGGRPMTLNDAVDALMEEVG